MKVIIWLPELFKSVFGKKPVFLDEKALRARQEEDTRAICSSYARGSISLKNGIYMTSEDLQARRTENISYKFN
jgi:hypothetical protein